METEKNLESLESSAQNPVKLETSENKLSIPMAIIVAGLLIAGAIYFSSIKSVANVPINDDKVTLTKIAPVGKEDRTLGNPNAKVTFVLYEDFQCPFCGAVSGLVSNTPAIQYLKKQDPNWTPFMPGIMDYVKSGDVLFVYRDLPFLGDKAKQAGLEDESTKSAEAARCAGDQGKFWEYHDYLYGHQNGEQEGAFSVANLKSFAKTLKLETKSFDNCIDTDKYAKAVTDSKIEASNAGITGTPKAFILKNGKVVSIIDGAYPFATVKQKIDSALKQ